MTVCCTGHDHGRVMIMRGLRSYGSTTMWVEPGAFSASVSYVRTDPDRTDVYGWVASGADGTTIGYDRDYDYVRTYHQDADARAALSALLSFLGADAERYDRLVMRRGWDDGGGYRFPEGVAEWAYGVADELAMARFELDERQDDES